MNDKKIHEKASLIRDSVFAASDGIITTFAVVAGSVGASFSPNVVIVMGIANLLADGLSMASGTYMGVKSESDFEEAEGDKHLTGSSPLKQGAITFVSFVISGTLPILPYLLNFNNPFYLSVLIVFLSMFTIGSIRGKLTQKNILKSGIETMFIGGMAAVVAYGAGFMIDKFVL